MANVLGVFVYTVEGFPGGPVAGFTIDGVDLRDLAYPVELPFARSEGQPELAARYEGLPAAEILPPSRHLIGEPRPSIAHGTALLSCECGDWACWPLLADVYVGEKEIEWSRFRQAHRNGPGRRWSYDGLGPFVFDRGQYEDALRGPWRGGMRRARSLPHGD